MAEPAKPTKSQNNLRKRGSRWELLLDLGPQAAQRCTSCNARHWVDPERLKCCPKCGGKLEDTRERRQLYKGGFPTKREAEQALNRLRADRDTGSVVRPSRVTVRDWYGTWLAGLNDLRDTTRASYERLARRHVLPHIGDMRMQEVDTARLNELYAALTAQGLAPATVQRVHAVVSGAFTAAEADGRIGRNPARRRGRGQGPRLAKEQTPEAADPKAWTREQVRAFLDAMRTYGKRREGRVTTREPDRLFALWRLLVSTGMRRGEALALTWAEVDFDDQRVKVKRSNVPAAKGYGVAEHLPKTARSSRVIPLGAETVAVLREHHKRQAGERLKAGPAWHTGPGGGYVFAYPDGRPMHPERVTRAFATRLRNAPPDLPTLTVHGLRHTWATLALQAGVPVHVVSEQLGHSSANVTLRIYAHVLAGQTRHATETVEALIDGAEVTF